MIPESGDVRLAGASAASDLEAYRPREYPSATSRIQIIDIVLA